MASEKQYLFFKSLYDEETERTKQLFEHAKYYLSLAAFYSAFVVFAVQQIKPSAAAPSHPAVEAVPIAVFFATIICMLSAFILALWGSGIARFEVANSPDGIVDQFGDEQMSDEEFFDYRIADFVVAVEHNSTVNDRKAAQLAYAGYALVAGIFLHACFVLLLIA